MSTVTSPQAVRRSRPRSVLAGRLKRGRGDAERAAGVRASPRSGGRTLFCIRFACAMSDAEVARLSRMLDLDTHMHPKLHDSPARPGVLRLDFESGLFLLRGAGDRQWTLEGRTWGDPLRQTVHEWQLRAVAAARRLDPTVSLPPRSERTPPQTAQHAPWPSDGA
jgi:hypothetical protein